MKRCDVARTEIAVIVEIRRIFFESVGWIERERSICRRPFPCFYLLLFVLSTEADAHAPTAHSSPSALFVRANAV